MAPYGKMEVKPLRTTTYTLSASNGGRSSSEKVTVIVNARHLAIAQQPAETPLLNAIDTDEMRKYVGNKARVQGKVTYMSEWVPERFSGSGSGLPWIFLFFMKEPYEGLSFPGRSWGTLCVGLREQELGRDYTGHFRAVIKPENLPAFRAILPDAYFEQMQRNSLPGALPSGYLVENPFPVLLSGMIDYYGMGTVMYLQEPDQLTIVTK